MAIFDVVVNDNYEENFKGYTGNPPTNKEEYGLRYQDTIPLLVAAIKEQQAIIAQLQADVATLKGAK